MKLKTFLKGIPWIITVILGISLFVFLSVYPVFSTAVDKSEIGDNFGISVTTEADGIDLYYLDGSTTVAITIDEKREYNWDWISIIYETSSDVWTCGCTDFTLKDSDSDGYVDWLGFTATGGATAGGEVRIRWTSIEGDMPGI